MPANSFCVRGVLEPGADITRLPDASVIVQGSFSRRFGFRVTGVVVMIKRRRRSDVASLSSVVSTVNATFPTPLTN